MAKKCNFLRKLRKIVQDCDPEVGGWNDDGTVFVVKKDERFCTENLAKYRTIKGSFIRQLNFYGFKKGTLSGTKWTFSHPMHQRDQPHLIHQITRQTRKDAPIHASKEEVAELREQMDSMQRDMRVIKAQLQTLIEQIQGGSAMPNQYHQQPQGSQQPLGQGAPVPPPMHPQYVQGSVSQHPPSPTVLGVQGSASQHPPSPTVWATPSMPLTPIQYNDGASSLVVGGVDKDGSFTNGDLDDNDLGGIDGILLDMDFPDGIHVDTPKSGVAKSAPSFDDN